MTSFRFYPGARSRFHFKFGRDLVQKEVAKMKFRLKFSRFPVFLDKFLNEIILSIETHLANTYAESVQRVIESGGMTGAVTPLTYNRFSIRGSKKVTPRAFRISTPLTNAFDFKITRRAAALGSQTEFEMTLGPGTIAMSRTIPKRYKRPLDESNTFEENPQLEYFRHDNIPTGSTRVAAAFEYGNEFQRELATPFEGFYTSYDVGFHPFEAGLKANIARVQAIYAQSIKKVFLTEPIISYKGKKWKLDDFIVQVLKDQLEAEIDKHTKTAAEQQKHRLGSNLRIKSFSNRQLKTKITNALGRQSTRTQYLSNEMLELLKSSKGTQKNSIQGFQLNKNFFSALEFDL